jgi:hypothetical protein
MPARKKDPETGEELLTTKEYLFVEYYLGAAQGNATQAALMAGYSAKTAQEVGAQNLSKLIIQKRVEQRKLEAKVSTDEVLLGLGDVMRGSLEDFFDVTKTGWKLNLKKAQERGKLHLLKKLSYDKRGKPTIELHSSLDAKKTFVRILGLEKMPQENPADGQAKVERAIEQFMKETGSSREVAIEYLAPLMPEVNKFIH